MSIGIYESNFDGEGLRIGIVQARFNEDICHGLRTACLAELKQLGVQDDDVLLVTVPGALEIPLALQKMAESAQFDALIALGAVIRGETTHYDYVCQQVSSGCQNVALEFEIPVIFGVLTTENEAQAWDRLGGKHGHKGVDAADCALAMYSILEQC